MTTSSMTFAPCGTGRGWRAQFACPTGWVGWLVGHLMALKNRERSLWVLSALGLEPGQRVLEIGFGSGVDVRRVSRRVTGGLVAGVDHSAEMVRQASRRNARALAQGRVELKLASASCLPWPDGAFDTVYSINTAQFWKDKSRELAEVRRVLRPGGLAALAVQPRGAGATEETARLTGAALVEALRAAGFAEVRLESRRMRPVSTALAFGRDPQRPSEGETSQWKLAKGRAAPGVARP